MYDNNCTKYFLVQLLNNTNILFIVLILIIMFSAGISSVITLAFWILFTSNTPSTNRYISTHERNYIINSLKGQISEDAPKVRC